MNIRIICVGKLKERFFREGCEEYLKRLKSYAKIEIIEVADEKAPERFSEAQKRLVLSAEAKGICKNMGSMDYNIALDIKGQRSDSEAFADMLQGLMLEGKSNICFIIGGSLGLDTSVLAGCDGRLSFSDMTFGHNMMRMILLEQIYRAFRIINNEPYHK